MKDRVGNELQIGDKIVYVYTRYHSIHFEDLEVLGFSKKSIRVKPRYVLDEGTRCINPRNCFKGETYHED